MSAPAPRARRAEASRLLLLAAVAAWLFHPFATGRLVGSGESLWYANMLADFVTQLRAGIFPIFAGQSLFAFNGAVYPLRVAPLYQHLAGALDLLTARQLSFFGLQHLVVITCGVAGLFGCYFALVRIAPRQRWSAAVLSVLYLSCPGVLALIYTQDLYMSWMTVPFLPLAVFGIVRTFQWDDWPSQFWLAAPLAALWWGHSPIALWMTGVAALTQAGRLLLLHRGARSWRRALGCAAIFAALVQYPFVSLHYASAAGSPSGVTATLPHLQRDIVTNLRGVFPAIFLPVSPTAMALGDLQLGYALWAALAAGLLGGWMLPKGPERMALRWVTAGCLVLLVLLLPIPGVMDNAWSHLPAVFKRITYYWPMQRFYPILAALLAFAGQLALPAWLPRPGRHLAMAAALGAACVWSLWEAGKFVETGKVRTSPAIASDRAQRPENLILTDHSYGLFGDLPPDFSNGVMSPQFELHLLPAGGPSRAEIKAPPPAPSFDPVSSGSLIGTLDANPGIIDLAPTLTLKPGQLYALTFDFANHDYRGILQLSGRNLFREYLLPASGELRAFGTGPTNSHVLPLWTTDSAGDEVTLRFIPTAPGAKAVDFADFGAFRLSQLDLGRSPAQITSLLPFRAKVEANGPTRLETIRMFTPGYVALVDGRPVTVSPSPAGRAMILVPAGSHAVELRFVGPFVLRASYGMALVVWAALLAFAGFSLAASRRLPPPGRLRN